ncbi:MAG: hypothetical protein RLZZ37_329, partial [Actinomycetota bacterium]
MGLRINYFKRPKHSKLPWTPIIVLTFLLALFVSVAFSIANNAFATGCTTSSTTSGDYTIVSFTNTGTCTWTVPNHVNTVDVLVVG